MVDRYSVQSEFGKYFHNQADKVGSGMYNEYVVWMSDNDISIADLTKAIENFRLNDENYEFIPQLRALKPYFKFKSTGNNDRDMAYVENLIEQFGWEVATKAIMDYKLGKRFRRLLISWGYSDTSEPYFCLSPYRQAYLTILHNDSPYAACAYAAENAPEDAQRYYQDKAHLYSHMTLRQQQNYYPYFWIQRREQIKKDIENGDPKYQFLNSETLAEKFRCKEPVKSVNDMRNDFFGKDQ